MSFETMGQRRLSTSSCFLEETSFPSEKKFGFWKPKGTHYCQVGLSKNSVLVHKSADAVASCIQQVELLGSTEEIDSKIIGNLLPDEDDLFSGVINELDHIADANRGNDAEDVDLFSSVGGMELEVDNGSCAVQKNSKSGAGILSCWSSSDGFYARKDSFGQHPSRTLSVRNISCNVEDSELRALFEKYGDVQTLCTARKHRGFALISYFDIRAARNAMSNLNNKMMGHWRLDIHYSIPKDNPWNHGTIFVFNINSSTATDALHQIFGVYGEIKEIREALCKCHHKFIEFYDVRAAEAARQALDKCNIAGKQIKLELNCPEDARHCSNKCSELEQDESGQSRSSNDSSLSETMCRVLPATFPLGDTTVSCFSNGSVQRLQSVSALSEKALSHGSCVLDTFQYPPRMASASDQFGPHKPSQSLDQVEFGNKCFESCHPYSFLDCQNISNPCESPNTVANMVGRIGARLLDKKIGGHPSTRSSNWQPMELEEWVAGPFGNATHPVNGHHWSNSTLCHHHPLSPMVWPDFPLFSNGVNAPCSKQLLGPFGTSPDVLNTVSPPRHLHVGSAPCIRPPFWNTQHSYTRESPEDLAVSLDSLRSEDFAGSFPLQLLGRPSHIFSNTLRNCMEKSSNDALHSPHQMSHISCGRTMVSSFPTTLASPSDCGRTFSHRRNQHSANHADKKQFELDIHRILRGEDSRTTLMIKNIPNKYTSKMLLATIDEHCRGSYDFIYLPIDFKNKCNVGYAFINLIDHLQIIPFHKAFSGKKWEKFNSEKVTALAYARIQGKAALIAHFQNSSLMNEDKRCRPILFSTGGPNAGQQEPFPIPTNIRSKASKAQNDFNENRQQGSLSTSVNGENSPNSLNSCGSSADSD